MKLHILPETVSGRLFAVSILSLAVSQAVRAQEAEPSASASGSVEEVVILGRFKSSANDIVQERMDAEVSVDLIDEKMISRIGDSTVGEALTRIPSVTLVDGKYVYVRGLGERYASTTLNGAEVPSPDLSRSVIPLDILPTSIVESLAVQKVFSADMPATFGGGHVDIRTRSIPEFSEFSFEIGTKVNTESRASALDYKGSEYDRWGGDDIRGLSSRIENAIDAYQADFTTTNIRDTSDVTLEQAEAINRSLLLGLKRDSGIYVDDSPRHDISSNLNAGYNFDLPKGMQFGFLAGVGYDRTTRNKNTLTKILGSEKEAFTTTLRSVHNVNITGDFSLGLRLNDDNSIQTTSIYIQDTDDEVQRSDILNTNKPLSGGLGFREYSTRYEIRTMEVNQVHGEHTLSADTLDQLGITSLGLLENSTLNWFYSESEATTEIPSELSVLSNTTVDTQTAKVLSETVGNFSSAATYRFTELRDIVDSWGWDGSIPFEHGAFDFTVSGGAEISKKTRTFETLQMFIDTKDTPVAALNGSLNSVFSSANVRNPDNQMLLAIAGDNEDSYLAVNKTLATFGKVDVLWSDTFRFVGGVRWEDFKQVSLPWNPLDYEGSQILPIPYDDPERVAAYFDDTVFASDDTYVSAALTYMVQDFWAQDFQLRFSYGETTVRPDLREISQGSYRDPITDILVFGNPNVIPAEFDNLDLRGEWFFGNGNNLTLTLFNKQIDNPIEMYQTAASDDNIAAEIINAKEGEMTGLEVEFLANMDTVHASLTPFFVQGNLTLMDQEIVAGDNADAPTNDVRPMSGASDLSGNLIFGFDSPNEQHVATVSMNYFSERVYFGSRLGSDDSYESPYTSLDFTYSYYPLEHLTIKFKAKNLLDEMVEITQAPNPGGKGVVIHEQNRGQTFSLDVQFKL